MALKEIEKLKEKVEKDPNSKLFVPLAEEYKKEGMLDEAIQVLLTGIERQPGYMSARVSLGKIYLEKGMRDEARTEFENVIKSIPDNLYAHKKLAEIYRDSGDNELAVRSYRTILKLNSMDEEALSSLREIEAANPSQEAPQEIAAGETPSEENLLEGHMHETPAEEEPQDDSPLENAADAGVEPPSEELNAFKESLFGGGDAKTEEAEEIAVEDLSESDADELSVFTEENAAEDLSVVGDEENEEDAMEEFSLGDEEVVGESVSEDEDIAPEETYPEETAEEGGGSSAGDLEAADRKVSQGDYGEAIRIYRKVLSDNPDDRTALQRLEELRSLLKMLGRDKEDLIARLNVFLEGIQKRHDEFFGST